MTFLKSLWADLIDKRLWPVALALLVALVAVPVALGGGDAEVAADPPLGATGATGADGQVAAVVLEPGFPVRRDRAGKVRDPFKQRKVAEPAVADAAAAAGAPPPAGPVAAPGGAGSAPTPRPLPTPTPNPSPSPSSPGSLPGSTAPRQPTAPKQTAPDRAPRDFYSVAIRLGRIGTERSRRKIERLTPLPSKDRPFFLYLGVLSDRKTAVFLLSADVKATGDGVCKPRRARCEAVELRRGDTELLDVTGADGKVTQYQLDLLGVAKERAGAPSRAVAAVSSMPTGESRATKSATKVPADEELGSDRYAYDDVRGLLERVKSSGLGGHLPTVAGAPPRGGLRGLGAIGTSFAVPEFFPGL